MKRTACLVLFALTTVSAIAHAESSSSTPIGFDGFGVFVGDGEYVPGSVNPDIPGCDVVPTFCDINYFWNEVVEFTPEEAAADIAAAKAFMMERYGIDVDASVAAGEITWIEAYADPRINYRARVLPNTEIHRYGWEVHDLSFLLIANVPIVLGGEFEGTLLTPGSLLAKGRYVIQKSRLIEHNGQPVLVNLDQQAMIEFQSGAPIAATSDSRSPIVANCEIVSSPWGTGIALVAAIQYTEDGVLVKNGLRNVLTFDGLDGLGDYPGVYNDSDVLVVNP